MVDGVTLHRDVEDAHVANDPHRGDLDESLGDNDECVDPGTQHPGAVLVNLEALDVDVRKRKAHGRDTGDDGDEEAHLEAASHRCIRNDDGTRVASEEEDHEGVAGQSMVEHELVTDDGEELEREEKADGDDAGDVHQHANTRAAMALRLPVSSRPLGVPVRVVEVQIHGAGGAEAEGTETKDDPEGEVVASLKAERIVDATDGCHERVRGLLAVGLVVERHCEELAEVSREGSG